MRKAEERRRLKCPQAYRDSAGRIHCKAVKKSLCANQRFCGMIGLWVENEFAPECPLRCGKQAAETAPEAPAENDSADETKPGKRAKKAKAEG